MKEEKTSRTVSISRRKFLKKSFALSTASSLCFAFPGLLFGTSHPSLKFLLRIDGFVDPYAVAVAPDGLIYVTDAGGYCVKIFDPSGKLMQTRGKPGSSGGRLNYPQGIDIDSNGDQYIVDSNNGRIAVFAQNGTLASSLGDVGGYPEAFYTPKGIFIGDNIYACNTRNHRLSVFDKSSHELIGSYGDLGDDPHDLSEGSLNYHFRLPTDVAVSENGQIYVVDSKHGEIKVLANDGKFLFRFGENGNGEGQLNLPEGITLDRENNVYVCDTMNGRIQKFDSRGKFLSQLDEGFKRPTSIYIDNENLIYVVDAELKYMLKFEWTA